MIFIYSLLIASLIVTGQALWKGAVDGLSVKSIEILSLNGMLNLFLSPKMIIGTLVYAVATIGYIYLLGKFNYFQIQSLVVGGSLVMTLVVAMIMFGERPSLVNIIGIGLILFGSLLVISR